MPRRIVSFQTGRADLPLTLPANDGRDRSHAYFLVVELNDRSWVVFTAFSRVWGLGRTTQFSVVLALLNRHAWLCTSPSMALLRGDARA